MSLLARFRVAHLLRERCETAAMRVQPIGQPPAALRRRVTGAGEPRMYGRIADAGNAGQGALRELRFLRDIAHQRDSGTAWHRGGVVYRFYCVPSAIVLIYLNRRRCQQNHSKGRAVSTVKPALTPEEWRAPHQIFNGFIDLDDGVIDVRLDGFYETAEPEKARHALAALALYGQPYGFTRDDAVACFHAAALIAYPEERELTPGLARLSDRLVDLARRIEALLPPEEAE